MLRIAVLLLVLYSTLPCVVQGQTPSSPELLRQRYLSEATGSIREYYIFLPMGYRDQPTRNWPTLLFLHGAGERGNGGSDLEKVLIHGPLMEAWIQGRDLPMIMIVPQAPFPDNKNNEQKLPAGFSEKRDPNARPPARQEAPFDPKPIPEDWGPLRDRGDGTVINAWVRIEKELDFMVRTAATDFRVDRKRIYLSGLSMGGFGSFAIAAKYPGRFAAIAPICGGGNPASLDALAAAQRSM